MSDQPPSQPEVPEPPGGGPPEPPADPPDAGEPDGVPRLPDDPSRWRTGDWAFDPKEDKAWEDPKILRRLIGTAEELKLVADAVVRRYRLVARDPEGVDHNIVEEDGCIVERAMIEELGDLILAAQSHDHARLAHVETTEDTDGMLRVVRRWLADARGTPLESVSDATRDPTELIVWHAVILDANFSDLDSRCTLRLATRFAAAARFGDARFAADARFTSARFVDVAWFVDARFAGDAVFTSVRFAALAWFGNARFAAVAWFDMARFATTAWFIEARFDADALFVRACFADVAWFTDARFARDATFSRARFAADAQFGRALFEADINFYRVKVKRGMFLTDARIRQNAVFDGARFAGFQSVTPESRWSENRVPMPGGLYLTGTTLSERLKLDQAHFGRHARLGLHRFLAVGDATIELDWDQLRPEVRQSTLILKRFGRPPARQPLRWVLSWLGLARPPAFIAGEDSRDPAEMTRAANDYELLAANFKKLPATDGHEDWCRWRAHELRRRAASRTARDRFVQFIEAGPARVRVPRWMPEQGRWIVEYFAVLVECLRGYAAIIGGALWRVIGVWLFSRTMVGYLLQLHRLAVSGFAILLGCAALYAIFGSDQLVLGNNPAAVPISAMDTWERIRFGLYFSLTTFVTLGYGDYAPAGWFKLVTGVEALLGVTLLALFTVAWGRKMVR